ncbi:naC domain-containing protein [Cardiosporidium cionae]|uniref:Nascent polypeptide-associated complex subunit beta n=1 Tax=Cardiosporidium cionae TaxID=476202 RepID=A0ABQ7JCU8_9APIC|nr:naC domain-containing protein [Cardiosporidium cionae]|eukprot:KAF8821847.1 naC domain-containing protein [Cardiosporidium cionae]
MDIPADIAAARARLKERMAVTGHQIGGKGTARRKVKKQVHKNAAGDERKAQQILKRIGTSNLADIEEVRMMKSDGKTLYFEKPKVQASPSANTYVVNGSWEERESELPGLMQELAARGYPVGSPQLNALLRQHMPEDMKVDGNLPWEGIKNDGDDVPDVVGNFEDVADEE